MINLKTNTRFILMGLLLYMYCPLVKSTVTLPTIPTTQFLITAYGASTSLTDNSSYINAAIKAANSAGGGIVVFPAGKFYSGPITMKSTVELYLAQGDTLTILPYGSGNGYPSGSYPNNGTANSYNPFISGSRLTNIAIRGTGAIEGNGTAWWAAYEANNTITRPCLIRFSGCTNVLIDSITLRNSPGVHVCLGQPSTMGSNGTISNITVYAPSTSPNTDAIDTWYWNGINIINCNLSEGDDNVAMDEYSENVTIKGCTLGYGHGISVGSYATNVNTVTVDSCTFTNTTNGIRLKTERGRGGSGTAAVYNLTYSNITMTNVEWPFYITSYYPNSSPSISDPAQAITSTTPTWRDIYFKNITVTGSEYAGFIWGLPEQSVDNVTFDNVQISATSRGMQTCYVDTLIFKNCSSITLPSGEGNAIYSPYDTLNVSGLNPTTGASTSCSTTTSGLEEVTYSNLHCFPNPVKGNSMAITSDDTMTKIEIYTMTGVKAAEETTNNSTQYQLNVSAIPPGYYILNVQFANGTSSSLKLIKTQ